MGHKHAKTTLTDRDWPNTIRSKSELDSALESGEKSGVSVLSVEEIIENTMQSAEDAKI